MLPRPGSLSTLIVPAHQGHQPGGDGQAQAGAAVLPRGRGVRLLEGLEDPLLLVGRDADAGVAHREAQADSPPSGGGPRRRLPRARPPRPSSVNLMALPTRLSSTWRSRPASPTRASGTSGCTWQISSSPFLWARTARARRVSPDRRPQGEVGRVQLELAGLDLGEVEHVVDDAEQGVGRRLDRLQVLPLVVGQGRVEGQLGHAEDGVHGGADLVADVGQELALGPVGRLRRLLGLAQLLLGPLALGDVADEGGEQVLLAQADGGDADFGGELAAVAAQGRDLEDAVEQRPLAGRQEASQAAR